MQRIKTLTTVLLITRFTGKSRSASPEEL